MEQVENDLVFLLKTVSKLEGYHKFLVEKHVGIARQKLVGAINNAYTLKHIDFHQYEKLIGHPPSRALKKQRNKDLEGFVGLPFFPRGSTEFTIKAFNMLLSKTKEETANL